MKNKHTQNDLYEGLRPTKGDYLTTGHWIGYGFLVIIVIGSLGYGWTRYVGSNQQRELLLNSGRREAASVVNLGEAITSCEGAIASRDMLKAQRDQYDQATEAYRLADIDVKGTDAAIAQCSGRIQNIIDTTEVENTPEFANLETRIKRLNEKL